MSDDDASLEERVCFLVPLNKLPAERRKRLLEQSEVLTLKRKQTLFEQGQRDEFTFYVLEGEIEMYADDSLIKRVAGGDGASFQPLAQLQPRQMTAIAKTRVEVLRVRRALLDQLLSMDEEPASEEAGTGVEVEEMEADQSGDWLMTLLQSELFSALPPANIQGLLDTLETVEFAAGDEVVRQGEPGDYYYAIQSGAAEVVRAGANRRAIKLADLTAGSTFGEEALVSGARRNATVRMTESGELARLTKEDFTRLIRAPLLTALSRERAEERVAAGARWLDVRFEDEAAHNGIEGALNLPLGTLRTRVDELDRDTAYVCYCDTGGRSSAAAFLLAEKGFDVAYVEGGAVAEPIPEKPAATA
ncbi:MAG: cyclic nucleotide-binding domain-containing protein, partial [Gammaproteobacteria bacterium]